MIVGNKMDRVGANFDRCLEMIRDRLSKKAFPIQLPVGSGELFTGHIDIIERREYIFHNETLRKTFDIVDVAPEFTERVEQARHDLIEAAVVHDNELLDKY